MQQLLIASLDLLAADVPSVAEIKEHWGELASTLPGYIAWGGVEALAGPANRAQMNWQERGHLDVSLFNLRSFLFFEQRRDHHAGGWGDEDPYIDALVAEIGRRVAEGVDEADPPGLLEVFPRTVDAESAHSAPWWRVRFNLTGRFDLLGPTESGGYWVAEGKGRRYLVRSARWDEEASEVIEFVDRAQLNLFLARD